MSQETNSTEGQKDQDTKDAITYAEIEQTAEFYDKMTPHLEKIAHYESLKAAIQESRMKNLMFTLKIAELKGATNPKNPE